MNLLVLAGTKDGRDIAEGLCSRGHEVIATTVTKYGADLFEEGVHVHTGPLNPANFRSLMECRRIEALVDATHPFAQDISRLAIEVCADLEINYIRFEREKSPGDHYSNVIKAEDWSEAAGILQGYDDIFLTIGSRNLKAFSHLLKMRKRVIARVLPLSSVIKHCESLGLCPDNIIAMRGPFSVEMNLVMFEETGAKIVVTKDSGSVGGVPEKIEAARALGIPVIIVERPRVDYPDMASDMEGIVARLRSRESEVK